MVDTGGRTGELISLPGFCFFHLVRRFWNQIFTWVSVRLRARARFNRSQTERYRVWRNLFSRETSCSYVKAVRTRRGLPCPLSSGFEPRSLSSSSSSSSSSVSLPARSSSSQTTSRSGERIFGARKPVSFDDETELSSGR